MTLPTNLKPETSWKAAFHIYLNRHVIIMLFLGFSAGLPLYLIFSTLSLWLSESGVDRSSITYFSWAALAYSFKFIWAPIIDKLPLPVLYGLLGRRRSWLLVTQCSVVGAIIGMAMIDPAQNLIGMASAVIFLGFASASQDIVIDAYRIEVADERYQAALSAMYLAGYRMGILVSGAGSLYLAAFFGTANEYHYSAWQAAYLIMAAIMCIGVVTTLFIKEPENNNEITYIHNLSDYIRFVLMFVFMIVLIIYGFKVFNFESLTGFTHKFVRLLLSLLLALSAMFFLVRLNIVNREMVMTTYIEPATDFFKRYGKAAVLLLVLVGFYRISDIVLGVIANVFYHDMGFSKNEIATTTKVFGVIMTLAGGFLGGVMTMRYGVMRILLLGAILSSLTNVLFMLLAQNGHDIILFSAVIAADNLSGGLAIAAFIAYLSSLTNISFTAMQYAILSSLMTLLPKLLGGYSGSIVNEIGYSSFFLMTALMGLPVILLIYYLMLKRSESAQ